MAEHRKIAAVLAADIVGFSRLTGADEDKTLARLRSLRSDLVDPTVAVHNGRIFKRTGDGILAEFRSVIEAVRCAIEVQTAMLERNAGLPPERRIEFRIGIHLGDVVEESDGDLMGDSVNIAARLEGIAQPGAICLSEDAYRQVRTRLAVAVGDLGETKLKNISEPMRVYALSVKALIDGAAANPGSQGGGPSQPAAENKLSIAVLPFANMSGDKEQEYFADGISEDVITALSKLPELFVIARNSSFTFKGKNALIADVSRILGARYVLEGSIRKAGNRVRITAQLIDATTGGHLWAERYDRDLTDIFVVQDDVTHQIVSALAVNLANGDPHPVDRRPVDRRPKTREFSKSLEAYDCFLRGRELWWRHAKEPNAEAIVMLRRAIEIDPDFVPPYACLAGSLIFEYVNRWSATPERSLDLAEAAARHAVELDDTYPHAHWAMAFTNIWLRRHDVAVRSAERSIALDPNFAEGHNALGIFLHYAGRSAESGPHFERAVALDPLCPGMWLHFHAQVDYQLGRYDQAIATLKRRILRNPETDTSRALLAACYGQLGERDAAMATWQEMLRINPDYSVEQRRGVLPYKNPEDFEHVVAGLRKAGLVA